MKNLLYLVVFIILGCAEYEKSLGSDEKTKNELTSEAKNENTQLNTEINFDCHIKYLDAIFLQKPSDCDDPKPFQITTDSITSFAHGDTDLMEVVLYLDSLTGRESKFEFNLGTFGALITNYTDSLYALEREAWITEYEKKIPHNKK